MFSNSFEKKNLLATHTTHDTSDTSNGNNNMVPFYCVSFRSGAADTTPPPALQELGIDLAPQQWSSQVALINKRIEEAQKTIQRTILIKLFCGIFIFLVAICLSVLAAVLTNVVTEAQLVFSILVPVAIFVAMCVAVNLEMRKLEAAIVGAAEQDNADHQSLFANAGISVALIPHTNELCFFRSEKIR